MTSIYKGSQMSYKTIKTLTTTWQPFLFKGIFIKVSADARLGTGCSSSELRTMHSVLNFSRQGYEVVTAMITNSINFWNFTRDPLFIVCTRRFWKTNVYKKHRSGLPPIELNVRDNILKFQTIWRG